MTVECLYLHHQLRATFPIHRLACADQAYSDSLLRERYLHYHESCGCHTKCGR